VSFSYLFFLPLLRWSVCWMGCEMEMDNEEGEGAERSTDFCQATAAWDRY
jgi:hypothetical protein